MIVNLDILNNRYYIVSIHSIVNHAIFVDAMNEYEAVKNVLINQNDAPLEEIINKLRCVDCRNQIFKFGEIEITARYII